MLSLGAALTFLLARRAAGSLVAALLAVAIHIALDARHYNYPKIVLYAAGHRAGVGVCRQADACAARGAGRDRRRRVLFRHDTRVSRRARPADDRARAPTVDSRRTARGSRLLRGGCALRRAVSRVSRAERRRRRVLPPGLVYVQRDAERTSFSFPRLSFDSSRPLLAISGASDGGGRCSQRAVASRVRGAAPRPRETKYGLHEGTAVEGTTWRYRLVNVSRSNIEALVRDPLVDDTSGIDRARFTVAATDSIGLETQLDTVENATAFLVLRVPGPAVHRSRGADEAAKGCGCDSCHVVDGAYRPSSRTGSDVERRIHEPGQYEHPYSGRRRHLRHPPCMADGQRHGPGRTAWLRRVAPLAPVSVDRRRYRACAHRVQRQRTRAHGPHAARHRIHEWSGRGC